MGVEIERKFLLSNASWRAEVLRAERMRQGYLAGTRECSVRVRISGEDAWLNIKGATLGIQRLEFEYAVPVEDAHAMLRELCGARTLEKTRHHLRHGGHEWEIDEFDGANAGLVVAELELTTADETFERPPWLGKEVSHDPRYYNSLLVEHPYSRWRDA